MKAQVLILNGQRKVKLNRDGIDAISRYVLGREGPKGRWQLSLYFVGDSKSRDLNREYLKRDVPTDVLAFSMREGPDADDGLLGDVVISTHRALANAERFGTSVEDEIARYIVHGVLHLLGYDDEGKEKERMREREEILLVEVRRRGWRSVAS